MFTFKKLPLMRGMRGTDVRKLQELLLSAGFVNDGPVTSKYIDGIYGTRTYNAVVNLQEEYGLKRDGIFGRASLEALRKHLTPVNQVEKEEPAVEVTVETEPVQEVKQEEVKEDRPEHIPVEPTEKPSKSLNNGAILYAARELGVDVASIRAVDEVESLGSGFNSVGMVKILFERHIFYRELKKKHGVVYADQIRAKHPDICSKTPGGYNDRNGKNSTSWQHKRLDRAIAIDRECALKSASWGRYQIMGFNHHLAGFPDVESFCVAMWKHEDEHLKAFVNFIKANPVIWRHLKNKNWSGFALGYNGEDYKKNRYDTKLFTAHNKYSRMNLA